MRPLARPAHHQAVFAPVLAALVVLAGAGSAAGQALADALPADAAARFLSDAPIVGHKGINRGVTHPVRVTLRDGATTHDAVFSAVDEHVGVMRFSNGRMELNFVDSYKNSIAAYRLARLLGLDDMMPVTVERKWRGDAGALSWFIDAQMDEAERMKAHRQPPDREAWSRQWSRMDVFAQLVADTDRNAGNILIDHEWRIWMIDFTRAFRLNKTPLTPDDLKRCDRQLLERLRGLTRDGVEQATRPYIGRAEIEALLARRDAIVRIFEEKIAKVGADVVLF